MRWWQRDKRDRDPARVSPVRVSTDTYAVMGDGTDPDRRGRDLPSGV